MPGDVDTGGGKVLTEGVSRLEVDALQHALLQVGRHRLTSLIVTGIVDENLRNGGKRLIELGRHLHEVAGHAGTAQTVVLTVGEHTMQGVTKLMEHSSHLVPRQQRGHTIGSLGVVAHIKYNRYLVALTALLLETVHPGSSALRGTAVVIAAEQGQRPAILVDDLEGLHIRMIEGNILTLLERQTIDTVGGIEDSIDKHAVDIEVGFHLVVGDIQEFLLHLCRVVETVVRLQLEVRACGLAGKVLDGLRLGIGLRRILADEVLQEGIDIIRCLGHRPFQRVRCIVGIAHDLCLLCPQPGHLADDREGVVLACTVGTMDRSLKDLLAQIAVVEVSQDSLLCRVYNDDGIGSLTASVLSIFLALGGVSLAESSEFLLLVHPDNSIVSGCLQQVAPLLLKIGNPEIDFLHTLHLVL